MSIDSNVESNGGHRLGFTPMQIAHHSLFTAREKLELLNKIKSEVSGVLHSEAELGFAPEEIDRAIAEVRLAAQNGEHTRTVIWGDN
jgi:hypothetical protein